MLATLLSRSIRRLGIPLIAALVLCGAGCAAPPAGNSGTAPEQNASQPRPASRLDAPPPRSPGDPASVEINRSCSSDSDCTVKDVGNCCGYYPACVNVDSPTDPAGVKAQCAESGMASACGFPAITRCQCVSGECTGSNQALLP